MNFYELEAFDELSQTLHFARSAEKLNVSPSALSRMISRLEEETGSLLFERDNRAVALTKDGRAFAAFARKCLEEREDLTAVLAGKSTAVSGTLHVFASVTACYSIMPPFLKKLNDTYPDIHLSVETGDPALAPALVRSGRADLAVAAIPDGGFAGFDTVPVKRTPLVFAASIGGRYAEVSGSPQDIVSSVPLVLPKAGLARERFDLWTASRNVKPVIAAETEGNEAIMALVQLGLGIGLVPQVVLTHGPYMNGFTSHAAGNALGYYEVGFIQRLHGGGSESVRRLRAAVTEILHTL
ncbi:MAG: HTH-type transcriptional activator IlvY [Treponema sp.]|nr:HTH-type transcriptional activator IlvY [Treponema sp.]